jgi:hypothetical protein
MLKPDLVYLQETKLAVISSDVARNAVGADFASNFAFLPA